MADVDAVTTAGAEPVLQAAGFDAVTPDLPIVGLLAPEEPIPADWGPVLRETPKLVRLTP